MEDALRVVSEFRHLLIDVHSAWLSIDRRYTVVGLSLLCATLAPELKHKSFVIHIITTFLSGFGGGMISAVLLMNPAKAPLTLMANNFTGLQFVACWWLMNHCPYGIPSKIFKWWPVKMVAKACVHFCRANLMMIRVDVATATYPGVHLGIIIVGTISICGGKMIVDTICHNYGILKGPHEASSPSYSFRSAFLGTLFYYFCGCCPGTLKLFSREEAAAIIITLFVVHSLLSDLSGRPLDWTKPILTALLTLGNIPVPESCNFQLMPPKSPPNSPSPSPKPQATPPPPQQQQQQQQGEKATSSQETAKVDVRNGKAAIAKNASGKGSAKSVKGSAVRISEREVKKSK